MRKGIYSVIATLALVILCSAVSVKGQSGKRTVLQADIPFEFSVGKVTLPAGQYTVRNISDSSDLLQLVSNDGHARALVQMNSVTGKADDNAKLVFNRYGNHYFFTQAWMSGTSTGLQALKSRAERAVERELASLDLRVEEVVLTARN